MPSPKKNGWGKNSNKWRVKDGNKVVFEHERESACREYMRKNKLQNDGKFRLFKPGA